MAEKIGLDMKFYRMASGTWASPVYALVDKIRTVTLNLERAEADVSSRGSVWRKRRSGLIDASVDAELIYDPADTSVIALEAAFTGGTNEVIAVADGAIGTAGTVASGGTAGSKFLKTETQVFTHTRAEPLEEGVTLALNFKPTAGSNTPVFVTVA